MCIDCINKKGPNKATIQKKKRQNETAEEEKRKSEPENENIKPTTATIKNIIVKQCDDECAPTNLHTHTFVCTRKKKQRNMDCII